MATRAAPSAGWRWCLLLTCAGTVGPWVCGGRGSVGFWARTDCRRFWRVRPRSLTGPSEEVLLLVLVGLDPIHSG